MKALTAISIAVGMWVALKASSDGSQPWSRVYGKVYTKKECEQHQFEKKIVFTSSETIAFTQLIVCFNAERPQEGVFEFFLRAHTRGKSDDEWQPWCKIASWSDSAQRSFSSKNPEASFQHVRLEMNEGLWGNRFEVRVEGTGDASLDKVKALFVCASNLKNFKQEKVSQVVQGLSSVFISGVPKKSQKLIDHPRMGALCSPTTISMILEFLTGEVVDPLETARNVYDESLDIFGNWPINMAYAFEKAQGNFFFYVSRFSSFSQLHHFLSSAPVGVSVRGNIKGARKNYPNGHLLVVVGYDALKKQVICFDPAFDTLNQVEVAYDIAEFLPAWERSHRLVYVMRPCVKNLNF